MWYLKVNITGGADYELMKENYLAAWDTLKERFDKKRALASA